MQNIKDIAKKTQSLKLLYVEDEEEVRIESSRFFSRFFSSVTTASNGEEAWELFQSSHFDLVITDLRMPIMNGNELMKKIKEHSSNTVTVLMSGISIDLDENIVANFTLDKPVDFLQFIEFLKKYHKHMGL